MGRTGVSVIGLRDDLTSMLNIGYGVKETEELRLLNLGPVAEGLVNSVIHLFHLGQITPSGGIFG